MTQFRAKHNVRNESRLQDLMTAAPMSAEAFAAIQRQRTEQRRRLEDIRMAAQIRHDALGPWGEPVHAGR